MIDSFMVTRYPKALMPDGFLTENISYAAPAVNGFSLAGLTPDEIGDGPVVRFFRGGVEVARRQFACRAVVGNAVATAAFPAARLVRAIARNQIVVYLALRHLV
jgi:hypothetical protein